MQCCMGKEPVRAASLARRFSLGFCFLFGCFAFARYLSSYHCAAGLVFAR